MRSLFVIKMEPVLERTLRLAADFKLSQAEASSFYRAPQAFDENSVHPALFAVHGKEHSCVLRADVYSWPVNCAPWSVSKISGTPYRFKASSKAADVASIMLDSRQ